MIRVNIQPEPLDFGHKVREPGEKFLKKTSRPSKSDWERKRYWSRALDELYEAYGGICAYCAEWIPSNTGDPTVDHYVPKSASPELAYEWSNFRLSSLRFNMWKREYQDVLDPFAVESDWFHLLFPSLQIMPNPDLSEEISIKVQKTIARLRLNEPLCIKARARWIMYLNMEKYHFDYLQQNAPFIASELRRQGLIDKISEIMKF